METYVDVRTNVGDYTVEINTGGWGAAKYTVWTDTGEAVADGVYAHAYDTFQEVADAVVEKYLKDFELAD
jgi:hypothetical protein